MKNPCQIYGPPCGDVHKEEAPPRIALCTRAALREAEAVKEKELLRALGRRGKLSAVDAALETSLSVDEANKRLHELAVRGHLEMSVEHGRLVYSFWGEHGA